jgi:hypothetical protein
VSDYRSASSSTRVPSARHVHTAAGVTVEAEILALFDGLLDALTQRRATPTPTPTPTPRSRCRRRTTA